MNYELENKFRQKADRWDLESTNSKVRDLDHKLYRLEGQVNTLRNKVDNLNNVISKLLNLLAMQDVLSDISNDLIEIKHEIY